MRQSTPSTTELHAELRRRLLALRYEAFAHCLCTLLERAGYRDVRPTGRTARRGRNHAGGYDIEALLPAGVGVRRVIVQVKQYDALMVHQRQVDELRGACLRAGAAEALLVTTAGFSRVLHDRVLLGRNAGDGRGSESVAPVRLIGGGELLALMVRHRVGVQEDALGRGLRVDAAFFRDLAERFPGKPERSRQLGATPNPKRWSVTVQVALPPRRGGPDALCGAGKEHR